MALADFLRRGWDALSALLGRRPVAEEPSEEEREPFTIPGEPEEDRLDIPEAELEDKGAPTGALSGGELVGGAELPKYKVSTVDTQFGKYARFTSETEDITSSMNYLSRVEARLKIFMGKDTPREEKFASELMDGIFIGDAAAIVDQFVKGANFDIPGVMVDGETWATIYLKNEDGTPGRIVMQKKMLYHRYFRSEAAQKKWMEKRLRDLERT